MLTKTKTAFLNLMYILIGSRTRIIAIHHADGRFEYKTVISDDQLPCRVKLSLIRMAICAKISNGLLYLRYGKEIFKNTDKKE